MDKLKVQPTLTVTSHRRCVTQRHGIYAVESIIGHRKTGGRTFVLVHWVGGGYEPLGATHRPPANVSHLHILLADYFKDIDVSTI